MSLTQVKPEKKPLTKPAPKKRGHPDKLATDTSYPRSKSLSKEQKAAAKALHLRGGGLEAYLAEEEALQREEEACSPDTLFPDPGYEHATPTTFGLWREGRLGDARLESLYGPHIRSCSRCSDLYDQYKALRR